MTRPRSPTALLFHKEDYSPNISQIKVVVVVGGGTLGGLYDPAVIGSEVSFPAELPSLASFRHRCSLGGQGNRAPAWA